MTTTKRNNFIFRPRINYNNERTTMEKSNYKSNNNSRVSIGGGRIIPSQKSNSGSKKTETPDVLVLRQQWTENLPETMNEYKLTNVEVPQITITESTEVEIDIINENQKRNSNQDSLNLPNRRECRNVKAFTDECSKIETLFAAVIKLDPTTSDHKENCAALITPEDLTSDLEEEGDGFEYEESQRKTKLGIDALN
eukprot:Awhi_evm1s13025